jgi:hypothetical protein
VGVINRQAIIATAVEAANDSEWGYEAEEARDRLNDIDPDYDWGPELLQYELEHGYRQMGPRRPPTEMDRLFMGLYLPHLKAMLEPSPLFKRLADPDVKLDPGGSFTIPLEIKKNDQP